MSERKGNGTSSAFVISRLIGLVACKGILLTCPNGIRGLARDVGIPLVTPRKFLPHLCWWSFAKLEGKTLAIVAGPSAVLHQIYPNLLFSSLLNFAVFCETRGMACHTINDSLNMLTSLD